MDSAQISSDPNRVTAHRGMLSSRDISSMRVAICSGSSVGVVVVSPDAPTMVFTAPCAILNREFVICKLYVMAALAQANRTKTLNAASGRFSSAKEPQVFMTPITKNSVKSAYAMALSAPLTEIMVYQMAPPRKSSGAVVISDHISDSLSFHVARAEFRLSITKFPINFTSYDIVVGRLHWQTASNVYCIFSAEKISSISSALAVSVSAG